MNTKVFVGNLPWSASAEDLESLFSPIGVIKESIVIRDRATKRSKGFGFVTFETEGAMRQAISQLNGHSMEGRDLIVSEAREPKPREGQQTAPQDQ